MSSNIRGNLEVMSLPDVLQWIGLAQKTGSLTFERGRDKKVIFFSKGVIIGANSNNPKDKIGELLVRMDKLTAEIVEEGLQQQRESGELIGDIFLARGYLTTQEFITALERQATEIIYDLFAWRDGRFIFLEKLPRLRTIPIAIKVDFILMEGLRRVDEWQRIREIFPTLNTILSWDAQAPSGHGTDDEKIVLRLINGRNSILDICDQSPLNDFDTCNLLFQLHQDGRVHAVGERGPHEITEEDDLRRLLSRGKAFYQNARFGDAIPFFDRVLKIQPEHKEAARFMTRSVAAIQKELLDCLGSPNALLEIDPGFRFDKAQELTAAEGFVLSRIDGKSTAKEITYVSGLPQTEACLTLNRLFKRGIIRAGREKTSKLRHREVSVHREVLDPETRRLVLDVSDTFLSEVVLDLIKQRQTGVLQLLHPPMDLRVYVKEGALVYATSNMQSDRTGSIMRRRDKLTEEQYDAVRVLAETEGIQQGNAMVKLGYVTPNDLIWLTKAKVEDIIISLFGWRQGKIFFYETDLAGFDIIRLNLSPGRLILEGTWRYFEEAEILAAIGSWDVLFEAVNQPPLPRSELDLTEPERRILGCVNGRHSIDEIAALTSLDRLEVLKVLFGFLSLGVILITGQVEPSRAATTVQSTEELEKRLAEARRGNYYDVLELDPKASEREIKRQFYKFSKRYHPDKSYQDSDPSVVDLKLKLFLLGKDAYETLSRAESRMAYDDFLRQRGAVSTADDYQAYIKPDVEVGHILQAEEFFDRGRKLLFSGRAGDALAFFEKALERVPDDPDYSAYTGLAVARMKKDHRQAVHLIETAIASDGTNADYFAFLGEAHLRYGFKAEALEAFADALQINPRHIQARREHARLRRT